MAKYSSQGDAFYVHDGGTPGVYIQVDNVTNIRDMRSGSAAEEDVSDLSSQAVEVMFHLPDNGSMSADVLFDPVDPGQIRLGVLQRTVPIPLGLFRVTSLNPVKAWDFAGYVVTFPFTLATATAKRGSFTVRISGAITET
jgi:hypothetical protein